MAYDVIFEKKVGDNWQPVLSAELHPGDVTRMKEVSGSVIVEEDGCAEYRVARLCGVDPDSSRPFDLELEPII